MIGLIVHLPGLHADGLQSCPRSLSSPANRSCRRRAPEREPRLNGVPVQPCPGALLLAVRSPPALPCSLEPVDRFAGARAGCPRRLGPSPPPRCPESAAWGSRVAASGLWSRPLVSLAGAFAPLGLRVPVSGRRRGPLLPALRLRGVDGAAGLRELA